MDLIDRQAAIDDLRGKDPSQVWDTADIEVWVNALPSAQPETHWIPCNERLPKKSGQYYVSGGDKVWICEFLIIPNFVRGWCNDGANPVVRAWMSPPEPYKGDKSK